MIVVTTVMKEPSVQVEKRREKSLRYVNKWLQYSKKTLLTANKFSVSIIGAMCSFDSALTTMKSHGE